MAITYQSIQTASSTSPDITITKPTSLAEGDLMVAGILIDGNSGASIPTPTGWTLIETASAASRMRLSAFYKIADSSDAAASDFTFEATAGTSGPDVFGFIIRATSPGILAGSADADSGSVTTLATGDFTPTRENCLFFIIAGVVDTSGSSGRPTVSGYALGADDSSWTERADFGIDEAGVDVTLAVATATRPEDSAITSASADFSESVSAQVIALAFSPQVDGSITEETKVNAYALNPIPKTEVNAVVDDPSTDISKSTTWTNPDKPSTTWINQEKS